MSVFQKLKKALVGSSSRISSGIDNIFFKKQINADTLMELEELLISSDLGVSTASALIQQLKKIKVNQDASNVVIKNKLSDLITDILMTNHQEFVIKTNQLNVILVCGVNGNGKTTTIGKLSAHYIAKGMKVSVAACDTFRAAAVEQLEKLCLNSGALFIKGPENVDPASVAYQAMQESIKNSTDILFIDTAGRLHNKQNLMDELGKIIKVIKKINPSSPHYSMLTIDATTGQNAYNQVEQFSIVANVNSITVTKLDGSAKAGVVIGIIQKYQIPIHFIGIGEKIDDLKAFEPSTFASALLC